MAVHHITTLLLCVIWGLPEATPICDNSNPCPFTGGQDLSVPTEYSSEGTGLLNVTLTVDLTPHTVDWLTIHRRTYNGEIPGPTLRVRPGDKLYIKLVNNMRSDNVVRAEGHGPVSPNITNLHLHGMHVSPKEPHDNVFIEIGPGSSYQYEFDIPDDHPAGTFYYHHHIHGNSHFCVGGGLVGFIIVEDDVTTMSPELSAISCPLNCHKEVQLAVGTNFRYTFLETDPILSYSNLQKDLGDPSRNLDPLSSGTGTMEDWLMDPANGVDYLLTNGQLWPKVTLTVGEVKRFRIMNGATIEVLEIAIKELGCEMMVLAWDGIYVDAPYRTRMVVLSGGARVDVAVRCWFSGDFTMTSIMAEENDPVLASEYWQMRFNQNLLTLHVEERAAVFGLEHFPTSLPAHPGYYRDLRTIDDSEIDGRFVIEFGPEHEVNREHFKDAAHYRYKYKVGTIQEWYIINTEQLKPHPLHIHVNHFQVISYNEYTHPWGALHPVNNTKSAYYDLQGNLCDQQFLHFAHNLDWPTSNTPSFKYHGHHNRSRDSTPAYIPLGEWRDTINVPPLGSMTIRFVADRYTGTQMIHCHNLNHVDRGMGLVVEVVEEGESIHGASTASGGAYPGTCRRTDPYPDVVTGAANFNGGGHDHGHDHMHGH
ncbi:multicopper oxidase mco-like [Branchiostoma lanceolatum]|uniref:multicopper oxidase mco-like n=1 Tax=Branchiostoma lanceolatum TaxID=7740 RepID=UPI00345142F8